MKREKPVKTHAKEKQIVKMQQNEKKNVKTSKNNTEKTARRRTLLSESCQHTTSPGI